MYIKFSKHSICLWKVLVNVKVQFSHSQKADKKKQRKKKKKKQEEQDGYICVVEQLEQQLHHSVTSESVDLNDARSQKVTCFS